MSVLPRTVRFMTRKRKQQPNRERRRTKPTTGHVELTPKPGRAGAGGRDKYKPGVLPNDIDGVGALPLMPAHALPTVGLAYWYLQVTPNREANQCLLASTVLMMAMQNLGVRADLVALMVDVPWGDGGRGVRYGSEDPRLDGDVLVGGHIGLIAGDMFIDPTASQFPEIRNNGGQRPLYALLGGKVDAIRERGAQVVINLARADRTGSTGKTVVYHVGRVGTGDGVGSELIGNHTTELASMLQYLTLSFGVALSRFGRADDVRRGPNPRLADLVARCEGMTVADGENGAFHLVPGGPGQDDA